MSEVLYVVASPRTERSSSIAISQAFLEAYGAKNAGTQINQVDIFKERLPVFDGPALDTKYAILHGQNPTAEQRAAWTPVVDLIEEFKHADKYVFAVPMWNFGIPYRLKQYFDVLVQPTYTFSFSPAEGYKGLVTGKPVFIAYARGGIYGDDASFDFQKRYMELILKFIGFTDIRSLVFEGTLMRSKEELEAEKKRVFTLARKMGEEF
jgi:FMN-dependent NADH-azoreductase